MQPQPVTSPSTLAIAPKPLTDELIEMFPVQWHGHISATELAPLVAACEKLRDVSDDANMLDSTRDIISHRITRLIIFQGEHCWNMRADSSDPFPEHFLTPQIETLHVDKRGEFVADVVAALAQDVANATASFSMKTTANPLDTSMSAS